MDSVLLMLCSIVMWGSISFIFYLSEFYIQQLYGVCRQLFLIDVTEVKHYAPLVLYSNVYAHNATVIYKLSNSSKTLEQTIDFRNPTERNLTTVQQKEIIQPFIFTANTMKSKSTPFSISRNIPVVTESKYLVDFGPLDLSYGQSCRYARKIRRKRNIGHMSNEKVCFREQVPYEKNPYLEWSCKSSHDLLAVLNERRGDFQIGCYSKAVYSHCQLFYLVVYDSNKSKCSSFQRLPYIKDSFSDVTLITILTVSRQDRLPYLLNRWKHRIVMAIFLLEDELPGVMEIIDKYSPLRRIKFVLYIVKKNVSTPYVSVFYDVNSPVYWNEPLFPINVLRDLAIESIETSHYYVSDIDVFPSDTLHDAILQNKDILSKPRTVFLLRTFAMSKDKIDHNKCRYQGKDCELIWDMIPHNKESLRRMYIEGLVRPLPAKRHDVVDVKYMMQVDDNKLYKYHAHHEMEPYCIMRRSENTPIFNPYFINYGYNKEEFMNRLTSMRFTSRLTIILEYNYYVLLSEFCFDIPHLKSKWSRRYCKDDPMSKLTAKVRGTYGIRLL